MGKLTTHVLDTASGIPASGLRIELRGPNPNTDALRVVATNADGRVDQPLLQGPSFLVGRYSMTFYVGDYFRRMGLILPVPPFLDDIVINFGIANAELHYHVPLLVSPWSYSTYRGS